MNITQGKATDGSRPQRSGIPANKVKTSTILVLSAIYPLSLRR